MLLKLLHRRCFHYFTSPHNTTFFFISSSIPSKMIPTALRTVARTSARRQQSAAAFHTSASLSADVSVEHGRGEWKTYGDLTTYTPGNFQIKTYNKISPHGLARFPTEQYEVKEG